MEVGVLVSVVLGVIILIVLKSRINGILDFVANEFTNQFAFLLWLIFLGFTIGGGILGWSSGSVAAYLQYGEGFGPGNFIGLLIGLFGGAYSGYCVIIFCGGFVANFLNIYKTLKEMGQKLDTLNNKLVEVAKKPVEAVESKESIIPTIENKRLKEKSAASTSVTPKQSEEQTEFELQI